MSAVTTPESIAAAEKRAKRFWIALVVFLFVIQSTIMGLVMHLAIGDPAAAVVPDYHRAALNWDETRRSLEAADRLGWKVAFTASDVADARGMRAVELEIHDEQGEPVSGLEIAGRLYHHAAADQVDAVEFDAVGEGRYLALSPAARSGLWQVELTLNGAPEPMTQSITFYVEE